MTFWWKEALRGSELLRPDCSIDEELLVGVDCSKVK